MTGQRIPFVALLAIGLALSVPRSGRAGAPDIVLPDPLAIELPAGKTSLAVDDEPMRDLIARVRAEGFRVTATLPRERIGAGVWQVTWSAWQGEAPSHPAARRGSWLIVLPHGMTPVASSGAGNATAGNNTFHIARDSTGSVHMVWYDSWRPGVREGALYRRARVLPDRTVRFETDITPLGTHGGNWTSLPTLAVVGDTIHFAWQAEGTLRYRFLKREGATWRWSDEVDTRVSSPGRDTGPSIAAYGNTVHILTPAAMYTTSDDGGHAWTTEKVPFGNDLSVKTVSLALDAAGRPLAAASSVVVNPPRYSDDQGHGGYWTIRLARRTDPGVWAAVPGPVDGRPEWAPPEHPDQDVLCDWVRVLEDRLGGIHVTWHGTAVSRVYANDQAYYAWRAPDGGWRAPISLRDANPGRGFGWSYAPALMLDDDRAVTLVFHALHVGHQQRGFDSDLGLFRDGKPLAPALPVTRFAERSIVEGEPANALSAWFPGIAPSLVRDADGRVWADILVALAPVAVEAPSLIVWQRLDLTDWLKAAGQ